MDSPNVSLTSGRCGMCGSCGGMPPWAPEMLKNTSPEARYALERRMQEAQRRFIERRDAKMKELSSSENEISQTTQKDMFDSTSRDDGDKLTNGANPSQTVKFKDELEQQMTLLPETAEKSLEQPKEQPTQTTAEISAKHPPQSPIEKPADQLAEHINSTDASRGLISEADAEKHSEGYLDVTEHVDIPDRTSDFEVDASIEIPLDSRPNNVNTYAPPSESESHQTDTPSLAPDEYHLLQPQPTVFREFSSVTLKKSPAPPETPELQSLSEIALESNQLSEPLRTISLRDADSDADSFHTAEGEEHLRRSSDGFSLKSEDRNNENVAPVVSESEWLAMRSDEVVSEPSVSQYESPEQEVSISGAPENVTNAEEEEISLEGHTRDVVESKADLLKPHSLNSQPSEGLEDSVVSVRNTTRGPSSPQAQRDALMDDYALPSDLVRPNEIDLSPQPCQDCERWRARVQELELKVEALTSALSAREMESASMRARVADRRYHGKNEAQLMQECESLRITTEYLVRVYLFRPFMSFLTFFD